MLLHEALTGHDGAVVQVGDFALYVCKEPSGIFTMAVSHDGEIIPGYPLGFESQAALEEAAQSHTMFPSIACEGHWIPLSLGES